MPSSLNIIFAGTPTFAAFALEALIQSSHHVLAVYTQPDRPAGRGLKLTFSPVKTLALQHQLPVYQPVSLKDSVSQDQLAAFQADVMVVAAYGLLLPSAVLSIPRFGCINIHPSLLPRWRGAAPIERSLLAGDRITGVSIMQMDTGLDTGPLLLQTKYVMQADETSESLHIQLAKVGAKALLETLSLLSDNALHPTMQNNTDATYAHKISKEEALIDWQQTAKEIECLVRAFNPRPVAYTSWQGEHLRIWQAKALDETTTAEARTIIRVSAEGIDIATGKGVLRLLEVQLPGSKKINIKDFYNAKYHLLIPGEHFV